MKKQKVKVVLNNLVEEIYINDLKIEGIRYFISNGIIDFENKTELILTLHVDGGKKEMEKENLKIIWNNTKKEIFIGKIKLEYVEDFSISEMIGFNKEIIIKLKIPAEKIEYDICYE